MPSGNINTSILFHATRLKSLALISVIGYFNCCSKKNHTSPAAFEPTPSPVSIATFGVFIGCTLELPKSNPLSTMPVFTAFILILLESQTLLTICHKLLPNFSLPFFNIITDPLPNCWPLISNGISANRIFIPWLRSCANVFADETPCQRMT